jgi:serine O-acetyltransferase
MSSLTTSEGMTFRDLVFSDAVRYRPTESPTWPGVLKLCFSTPGMTASVLLRAQQSAMRRGNFKVASLLRTIGMVLVSTDFVPGVDVGPGLLMPHPSGIVMGNGVVIGANVSLGVGVVTGVKKADKVGGEYPVICDGAIILSHAVVAGPLRIGSHAQVGANSLVLSDVADHEIVLGVPAQTVGTRDGRIPGFDANGGNVSSIGEVSADG